MSSGTLGLYPSTLLPLAGHHNFDNSKILTYNLLNVTQSETQELCNTATDSYARDVLNWPNGRLAKPEIFELAESGLNFEDIGACALDFMNRLALVLDQESPPYELPFYAFAFVLVRKEDLPEKATLVLLRKPVEEQVCCWESVRCPVEVELGMTVTSLMMVDESVEDVLEKYAGGA